MQQDNRVTFGQVKTSGEELQEEMQVFLKTRTSTNKANLLAKLKEVHEMQKLFWEQQKCEDDPDAT